MFWLEGHTITEVLFEGDTTTLYRGYRDSLTDRQLDDLAAYLLTLKLP